MSASRDYDVIVTRTGLAPGLLAASDRFDHIAVVSVEELEVVLFWDVPARATGRMEASLRDDLQRLESDEFIARWSAVESDEDY